MKLNNYLENRIKKFNDNKLSKLIERYKELDILRQKFVDDYPIEKIKNLTKKEYAVGLGKENRSFCYRLETELKDLGDMHGSNSYKFGLYYDKKEHKAGNDKINYAIRYGKNEDEVFENIKNSIVNLLKAGESNDHESISENQISNMFKGKILSIYYPDKYLCVFSEEHLDYFIEYLDIKTGFKPTLIEKQNKLIEWKEGNSLTNFWNNYVFMCFLYDEIKKNEIKINSEEDNQNKKSGKKELFNKESDLIKNIVKKRKNNAEDLLDLDYKQNKVDKPNLVYNNGKASYQRDKKNSLIALAKAGYRCEIEGCQHELFIRANDKHTYTEPHHLVPMSVQREFKYSLDIPENIVSLCSSCHNQIHYGKEADKLLEELYKKRKNLLIKCGILINFSQLKTIYKLHKDDDE